jgi:hypothetical protein
MQRPSLETPPDYSRVGGGVVRGTTAAYAWNSILLRRHVLVAYSLLQLKGTPNQLMLFTTEHALPDRAIVKNVRGN